MQDTEPTGNAAPQIANAEPITGDSGPSLRTVPRLPGLIFRAAVTAAGLGLTLLSIVAATSGSGFGVDLTRHFPAHYAGGLAICVVLLLGWSRAGVALLLVPALLWNVALMSGRYRGPAPSRTEARSAAALESDALDLVFFNVLGNNQRLDDLQAFIEDSRADVVILAEVRPPLASRLERGIAGWHVVAMDARTDNFGLAMLVADGDEHGVRVSDVAIIRLIDDAEQRPAVEATLEWAGRRARLLGVHVMPPLSPSAAARRGAAVRAAAAWRTGQVEPVIIIGDLNTTPWGIDFEPLERVGLVDGARGFGLQPTWPARLPPGLRIALDHVLHDPALRVGDHRIGPSLGSDHLAIRARLVWEDTRPAGR